MANELTKDNLEQELQRDLAELEGRGKKGAPKPEPATLPPTSTKKASAAEPAKPKPAAKKETKRPSEKAPAQKPAEPAEKAKKEPKPQKAAAEPAKTPAPKTVKKEEKKEKDAPKPDTPDDDARSKRIFYGGIAAIIIIFAALLIGGKYLPGAGAENTMMYNGYSFAKGPTHWTFDWKNDDTTYTIPLRFNPQETENVRVEGVLDPRFNKLSPIYISFDPLSAESNFTYLSLGAGELAFNLRQALGKNIESACAVDDGTPTCANKTIVNCETSEGKAVIYLKTEEPAGVFIDDTCIVAQGKDLELLRSIDRLLYTWYGVIE